MVATVPPVVETFIDTAQEEVERTHERVKKGMDILLARDEPPVGITPKDVIYSRGTLKLYHYRPMTDEVYRVPVIFVMSLVSKPWILDLTFGQSFVQYMLAQGFDVFMIDWGIPRPEDKKLKFEDYVLDLMPACIEEVQKATGEEDFSILGYCMGGLFALMYAAMFPDAPLKSLACAATPVDMNGMGLFRKWQDPRYFDVDRLVDTLGNIPPEMMLRSFELLRPMDRLGGYIRLLDNLWDPQFVYGFRIMYKWTNEQIPFPGETYRQFTKDLMWENKLVTGQFKLDGRPCTLDNVKVPVLHAMAEHDHIAPFAATKPLLDLVGSDQKEEVVLKGGHVSLVAGKNALTRLWPKVADWMSHLSV